MAGHRTFLDVLPALALGIFCLAGSPIEPALSQALQDETAAVAAVPGQSPHIASVPNLRDLGGYSTETGKTVAKGLLYRSNQLTGISPEDMATLAILRLKTVYDLRTAGEKEGHPSELPPGTSYVWLDVLADLPEGWMDETLQLLKEAKKANAALGDGKAAQGMEEMYRGFVALESARTEFGKLFLGLSDQEALPAVFHCTAGKDRTGWAAAVLLSLLGVPRETIYEDYLRSNEYILPLYQDRINALVATGVDQSIPLSIMGVNKAYLDAAFDEMGKRYGSVESYLSEGLGIDIARQEAIRKLYLVEN